VPNDEGKAFKRLQGKGRDKKLHTVKRVSFGLAGIAHQVMEFQGGQVRGHPRAAFEEEKWHLVCMHLDREMSALLPYDANNGPHGRTGLFRGGV